MVPNSVLVESANEMMLAAIARGTGEHIRSTPLLGRRSPQLLRSIETLEFDFTETLLKQHFVAVRWCAMRGSCHGQM